MQTHISLTHLSSDTLKHPPLSPERDLPSWIPKKFQKQAMTLITKSVDYLNKFLPETVSDTVRLNRSTVDCSDLEQAVKTVCSTIVDRTGKVPDLLFIGAITWHELAGQTLDYQMDEPVIANQQVYGMEVVVIPWLSGMLPLHSSSIPKNLKKKLKKLR